MTDKLENEVLEETVPEEAVAEKPKKRGRKKKVAEAMQGAIAGKGVSAGEGKGILN